ncbi:MBL fold metallo-hydrolase [Streptomyces antimycoticus]|nr:MBL fold metallo-hydrolase [Streptomyces sp. AgN23]WTA87415.1 MBL fold metallo-hydrolase [Streptomyces antimycoticus]
MRAAGLPRAGSPGPARCAGARAHTGTHQGSLRLAPARSGILITGDALVTADPTSRISGPQLLPDMFHTDRARALDSLVLIESLDADLVLPGHGPVHHG